MSEVWLNERAADGLSPASHVRTHDNIARCPRRHPYSAFAARFAHPAEAAIADLFDSFGVRWQYEPTTFPLVTSPAGLPIRSFTPDFYLPDHGTYIEMTTMRQSLVTRKNRKFRLMREMYPDVDVRLLYRKDVELIVNRPSLEAGRAASATGALVASAEQVQRKVREIAAHLAGASDDPLNLVSLGAGAVPFRDAIASHLVEAGRMVSSSRLAPSSGTIGQREPVLALEAGSTTDRPTTHVLVADVLSTGLTAHAGIRWLESLHCPVDMVIALLDRRSARLIDIALAVPAISCPSAWIVGCGLGPRDRAELTDLRALAF